MVALVGVQIAYGTEREYIFEIFAITINWFVLIIASALLSRIFKRAMDRA